jgi:hypothetical protein
LQIDVVLRYPAALHGALEEIRREVGIKPRHVNDLIDALLVLT